MSEWRKIWPNGLPDEGRSPKSGHRMAAEGIPFPWRSYGGTIPTNLDGTWGMSVIYGKHDIDLASHAPFFLIAESQLLPYTLLP